MKIIDKIKKLYYKKHIDFYVSISGHLAMGTVHLIETILDFSWLTFNYCLFFYILVFIKVLMTHLDKTTKKSTLYLAGALSLCVLLIPMTVAMVKTIMEKDAPVYFFYWIIYAYATYGTVKFVSAVRARHKARKNGDIWRDVLSWISLVTATYTLQMMEFALIATFDTEKSDSMVLMQYFTHGAILIFTIIVIIHLHMKYIKSRNNLLNY